jgi:D-glycero-alpha-D-manno-heptose-7-phosphate kinase
LDAIHIEQEVLRENVGSQDQTIAAFGGLNKIEFGNSPKMAVYPVTIKQDTIDSLYNHLMLYFTGFSRNASEIAAEQIKITSQKKSELTTLRTMVDEAVNILKDGRDNIMDFGKLLHESWQIKRSLTPQISTSMIDEIYQAGLEAGASGGKLLGAGGGGFILFFVPPELRDKVKKKLEKLLFVPFKFETLGSQIIYYMPEDNY